MIAICFSIVLLVIHSELIFGRYFNHVIFVGQTQTLLWGVPINGSVNTGQTNCYYISLTSFLPVLSIDIQEEAPIHNSLTLLCTTATLCPNSSSASFIATSLGNGRYSLNIYTGSSLTAFCSVVANDYNSTYVITANIGTVVNISDGQPIFGYAS